MQAKLIIGILAFMILFSSNTRTQDVHAIARFDTTEILIGDQIDLNISFTMPLDYRVLWPHYKDTLARNIEIISMTPVDTIIRESENLVEMLQSITITSFDSGYYYVAPLRFQYQPIDDTSFLEASSIPLYLKVHTMEVDTTQAIKAIKPPLRAPVTFKEVLPWILIALAGALIIFFVIWVIIRRKKNKPIFSIRPKIILPPHMVAMNGLEGLKDKKLWQSGRIKDYYTEMTDILRIYIEDRFDVRAVEMTTDEIIEGMKGTEVDKDSVDKLARTLVLADLVKFAREKPLALDNDMCMNNSISFVQETKSGREAEEILEKISIENGEKISGNENSPEEIIDKNDGPSFTKASEDKE